MTFYERYKIEKTWHGKVTIMEIYHLTMRNMDKNWSLAMTARAFECSIGLVSENLKLAKEIHKNPDMINWKSREYALEKLKGQVSNSDNDDWERLMKMKRGRKENDM